MTAAGADDLDRRLATVVLQVAAETDPRSSRPADAEVALTALESLQLVALIVRLEAEFGVELPAEQVVPENFTSLAALRQLVAGEAARR